MLFNFFSHFGGIPVCIATIDPTTTPLWQLSPPALAFERIASEKSSEYFQEKYREPIKASGR